MRRVLKFGTAGVAVLALLVVAAWFALDMVWARDMIRAEIEAAVFQGGEVELTIGALEPGFPSRIAVETIEMADGDGVWLTADGVELVWKPWSLLTGDVAVEMARAERVAVLREPASSASDPVVDRTPAGGMFPGPLPFGLQIDSIDVSSIVLGEALLGRDMAFSISGKVDLTGGTDGHVALDVMQTEGGSGAVDLLGRFDLSSDTLDVTLAVHEGPGGVLAAMLQFPDTSELTLLVGLEGAASDFSGTLDLSLGDDLSADLVLSGVLSDEILRLAIDGAVVPAALLDEASKSLMGQSVVISASMELVGERLTLETLKLGTRFADLGVKGTLDLADETIDLTVLLEGQDLAPLRALIAPADIAGLQARMALAGTLSAPRVALEAQIEAPQADAFAARQATVNLEGEMAQTQTMTLQSRLDLVGASTGDATLDQLVGDAPSVYVKARGDLASSQFAIERLSVLLDIGQLDTAAMVDAERGTVDGLDARFAMPMERLEAATGLPIGGETRLVVSGSASQWGEVVALDIELAATDASFGHPMLDSAVGSSPTLDLSLAGDGERWKIDDLTLDLPVWRAEGRADVDLAGDVVSAVLTGPVAIDQAMASALEMDFALTGSLETTIAGSLARPTGAIKLQAADGTFEGFSLAGLSVLVRDLVMGEGMSAQAGLALPFEGERVVVATNLKSDAAFTRLALPVLSVQLLDILIQGSAEVPLDGGVIVADLAGRTESLQRVGNVLQSDASGAMLVSINARDDGTGGQGAAIKAALSDVAVEGLSVGDVRATLSVTSADVDPTVDLDVSLTSAAFDDMDFSRILAQADGTLDSLRMFVATDANDWTTELRATGDFSNGVVVDVDTLIADLKHGSITSESPFRLQIGESSESIEGLHLNVFGGLATMDISLSPQAMQADVELAAIPVSALGAMAGDLDLRGSLHGSFTLRGDADGANASLDVLADNVGRNSDPDGDVADLRGKATWDGRDVDASVSVEGIDGMTLGFDARVPLEHVAARGTPTLNRGREFRADVTVRGTLEELWEHLPIGDQTLRGMIDVEVQAHGSLDRPVIDGKAEIMQARYENFTTGTVVEGLTLTSEANDDGSLSLSLQGSDGGDGSLTVSASAMISDDRGMAFEADVALRDFEVVRLDHAKAVAAAEVRYEGSMLEGAITGTVTVEPVNFNVAQALPLDVTVLDAQDVFEDKGSATVESSGEGWEASLDLTVSIPRRFHVNGRGLDSEWMGEFDIGGTTNAPEIKGQLDLVRGNLDVAGNQFQLTEGNVSLVPEDDFDPNFLIVAQADSGDMVGQLRVSGRVSAPKLEITSIPPLPEDEVLARTLFGKSSSALSGLQAVQLATAIAGLTGTGTGGTGVLDRTRQALGVDVLRVDTDAEGNTRVGAGSYVAEGVYVGVEQGAASGSSAVEVEVDVTDHIIVKTEAGADASARAGVEWKWEY